MIKTLVSIQQLFLTGSLLESGTKEALLPFQQDPTDVSAVCLLLVSVQPEAAEWQPSETRRGFPLKTQWVWNQQKKKQQKQFCLNEFLNISMEMIFLNDGRSQLLYYQTHLKFIQIFNIDLISTLLFWSFRGFFLPFFHDFWRTEIHIIIITWLKSPISKQNLDIDESMRKYKWKQLTSRLEKGNDAGGDFLLNPCFPSSYFLRCTWTSRFWGSNYHTPLFRVMVWRTRISKGLARVRLLVCTAVEFLCSCVAPWSLVPRAFCNSCSCTINLFWYSNRVTNMPK